MKAVIKVFAQCWQAKPGFRLSALYLVFLLLLLLVLPLLPLPYGPNQLDLTHPFQAPFSWELYRSAAPFHWLGTDALGRDVLVNVLFGARTAFAISLPVMLLSTIIGLLAGCSAGYFGDTGLKVSRAGLLAILLGLAATAYYGLYLPLMLSALNEQGSNIRASLGVLFAAWLVLCLALRPLLKRRAAFASALTLPLDQLVLRSTEFLTSIPRLLLILVLASFVRPSVPMLSLLLVITFWTSQARLARAEMLQLCRLPYFEAARSIGLTHWQLLLRHALPNMAGPVTVAFTFGLAGLLTLESTLSFLGIGVPAELVSWGRMMAGIRTNSAAWWLVAFPGGALALTVLALQSFSNYLLEAFQAKKHR